MDIKDIRDSRITYLNAQPVIKGPYILYWMQQSQRGTENHALEYSIRLSNELGVGVLVVFGLTDDYPEANLRHYTFMIEGLSETSNTLMKRGIKMVVQKGHPVLIAESLSKEACAVVCDCGYLRHQREWRTLLAQKVRCRVIQVESDVVVPLKVVSQKAEYAARTLRPKILRHIQNYQINLKEEDPKKSSLNLEIEGLDLSDTHRVLQHLSLSRSVPSVSIFFKGGTLSAKKTFHEFLEQRLCQYSKNRNKPQTDDVSHMSKYLHFGQISPVYLAMEIQKFKNGCEKDKADYLEELIVRRELSMNFVYYTNRYDRFDCIPNWAKQTLSEHRNDPREHIYSSMDIENSETHDEYWNAAMREMKITGYMHNYMRMYWGKKILEWSESPEEGFRRTLVLNNRYLLDGRDPNSFASVAWIYGTHDRPFKERPIFGKIRFMSSGSLERKCDMKKYMEKIDFFENKMNQSHPKRED